MNKKVPFLSFLEKIIFESRWILLFFYFGLLVGLVLYMYIFSRILFHSVYNIGELNKDSAMLVVLELVDMVMVGNVVKLIITGSYNSFITKNHDYKNENISSGNLKIKIATSLVGVSSINLLQTFLDKTNGWDSPIFLKQIIVHIVFLLGALVLSKIEYLHDKGEFLNKK